MAPFKHWKWSWNERLKRSWLKYAGHRTENNPLTAGASWVPMLLSLWCICEENWRPLVTCVCVCASPWKEHILHLNQWWTLQLLFEWYPRAFRQWDQTKEDIVRCLCIVCYKVLGSTFRYVGHTFTHIWHYIKLQVNTCVNVDNYNVLCWIYINSTSQKTCNMLTWQFFTDQTT